MPKKKSSLDWLIASRGYAMYGVFLGHLMSSYLNQAHFDSLIAVGRFLEPTFVPFFVMLTGAFYQRGEQGFRGYSWLKFCQRMLPFYFFMMLVLPFYFFFPAEGKSATDFVRWLPLYVVAVPYLSWPTWFLAALFISELFYFFIQPAAKTKTRTILLILACYGGGWLYNRYVYDMPAALGWLGMVSMLHAALLFCAYFLIGLLLKPYILKLGRWPWHKVAVLGTGCFLLMIPGVLLNEFPPPPQDHIRNLLYNPHMPMISGGQYGHFLWFFTSTLFGAGTLLCISRLIPVSDLMRKCGDHSLLLIGLNAIFHGVLNRYIVDYFPPPADTLAWTLPYVIVLSAASMLICLPIAIWLGRLFPQLTGRPMLNGPVLPAIYRKRKK